jgi:membrane-associated phospholipid phosphatase
MVPPARRRVPRGGRLFLAAAALVSPRHGLAEGPTAQAAPATAQPPARSLAIEPLFTRSDLRFGAFAVAAIAASTLLDRQVGEEAPEENSAFARHLAHDASYLGNPLYSGPALLAGYAAGRFLHRPALESGAFRVGVGVLAAGAAAGAIKIAVGRERPYETPGDADVIRPFSGHTSFPSGHTTVAFALAAGIDHVTSAKWVPWVVYPAAALVGWSRLRDDEHWTSDVVAGALVGTWTAEKAIRWLERRARGR